MHVDRRANYALAILTFINLFNYVDRWVVAAVAESLKRSLGLTDTELGAIAAGFIVVYAATSPIFGSLGDRRARPPLIALGVGIWSLATGVAGFARGFWTLFFSRSTVGVGEAAYGTIAPAMLADLFPAEKRGRVMAVFFAAIPIGSAAGFILGGLADHHFGWRAAFWLAGFPGLALAFAVLFVKDPPRGQHDVAHAPRASGTGVLDAYRDLLHNRLYILSVLGYAAWTFAVGGLGFWMPSFLERARGVPRSEATVTFGIILFATGFLGTFIGGWLGDLFLQRSKQSYLWVSGIATLIAAPLTFVGLTNPHKPVYLTAIVFAEIMIFMCTGPVNSAIVNAVSPIERSTAVGMSVFVMHVLGDIPSPPLIGAISDRSNLDRAVLVVPMAILLSGVIWSYAAWRGEQTA